MFTVYRMHDNMKNAYRILVRKSRERDQSGNLGIDGKIILKWARALVNTVMNLSIA
jgi:hypothetical protein